MGEVEKSLLLNKWISNLCPSALLVLTVPLFVLYESQTASRRVAVRAAIRALVFVVTVLLAAAPLKRICPILTAEGNCTRPTPRHGSCGFWEPTSAASTVARSPSLGMPSGHSASVVACVFLSFLMARKFWLLRQENPERHAWPEVVCAGCCVAFLVPAILVMRSRLVLQCHTPLQVASGAALGCLIAYLVLL